MSLENKSKEYQAGFDAGFTGPNVVNSSYNHFKTEIGMQDWQKGFDKGKKDKEKAKQPKIINP